VEIINCAERDIDNMVHLYRGAIEFQKQNGFNEWKEFDRDLVSLEIKQKRQWKIVIDGEIACIFCVAYSDPLLWRELDDSNSIYLHRIATNQKYKGKGFTGVIIEWARKQWPDARYIRMDTWAENRALTAYYLKYGFSIAGYCQLDKEAKDLPLHYSSLKLVLLQMEV